MIHYFRCYWHIRCNFESAAGPRFRHTKNVKMNLKNVTPPPPTHTHKKSAFHELFDLCWKHASFTVSYLSRSQAYVCHRKYDHARARPLVYASTRASPRLPSQGRRQRRGRRRDDRGTRARNGERVAVHRPSDGQICSIASNNELIDIPFARSYVVIFAVGVRFRALESAERFLRVVAVVVVVAAEAKNKEDSNQGAGGREACV